MQSQSTPATPHLPLRPPHASSNKPMQNADTGDEVAEVKASSTEPSPGPDLPTSCLGRLSFGFDNHQRYPLAQSPTFAARAQTHVPQHQEQPTKTQRYHMRHQLDHEHEGHSARTFRKREGALVISWTITIVTIASIAGMSIAVGFITGDAALGISSASTALELVICVVTLLTTLQSFLL